MNGGFGGVGGGGGGGGGGFIFAEQELMMIWGGNGRLAGRRSKGDKMKAFD